MAGPSPLAPDPAQTSPLAAQNAPPPAAPPAAAATPSYDMTNFQAATQQMKLNPQEQALYQMHLQNLHGEGGVDNPPSAENPGGSRSTLYQITVDFGGQTMVLPTVWGGKILPTDQAIQMAKQYGLDKFPSYSNDTEAESRYQQMHGYMEKDTEAYLKNRKQ